MKITLIKALAFSLAAAAASGVENDNGFRSIPAIVNCEYPDGNECASDEFCMIATGKCMSRIAFQPGTCAARPQACNTMHAPVCGCDSVTYGNECNARGAGVNVMHEGACDGDGTDNESHSIPDIVDCEYPDGNECAPNEFCSIATGKCALRIAFQPGTCAAMPQACSYEYAPVCGCDGVTYGNECNARGSRANVMHEGVCDGVEHDKNSQSIPTVVNCEYPDGNECASNEFCMIATGKCELRIAFQQGTCMTMPQACSFEYAPVCGCDGVTYGNECNARGAGANVVHEGSCDDDKTDNEPHSIPAIVDCEYPDGNECASDEFCMIATGKCMSRIAFQPGTCAAKPQACTYEYAPVCGCDEVTYDNECNARGAGVNVMHEGACDGDYEFRIKKFLRTVV